MNFGSKFLVGLSAMAIAASCSTTPVEQSSSPRAQQELAEALAGRVPGKPVSCLPNYRADNMQIIDDWTILFKDGRTIYLQKPRGGCPGIASRRNVLVTRLHGTSQLCSGDISHLVDPTSGIGGGACVFGDFVPYTKPAG
ncbi:MAG TPA: hypothetical protein VFO45_01575 [Sphingomicrobium sp.]|nr:hypothetical protein [Sphingomicrobium sp.]